MRSVGKEQKEKECSGFCRKIQDTSKKETGSKNNSLSASSLAELLLRTYAHQLLAATTALGVARVIRAGLPIRCDSSNRVLPTPGDAIPSNGLPPRPPPGQFRSRSPDRTTPFLATNHPANTPDSPESPRFILRFTLPTLCMMYSPRLP